MSRKIKPECFDSGAERIVLAAILRYGIEVFHDINSIVNEQYFYHPENKLIYSVIAKLINEDGVTKPSIAGVLTSIASLDKSAINNYELTQYLSILSEQQVSKEEVKPFLSKVARFGMIRNLKHRLESAIETLEQTDGNASIIEIIQKAEQPVVDFTHSIVGEESVINLSDYIDSYIEQAEENSGKSVGISTGMPIFDEMIGGGLRFPGIHIIGARSGGAKSMLMLNVAHHVSSNAVPILYLDTELTKEQTMSRWLARCTNIPINTIESGDFENNESVKKTLKEKAGAVIDSKQPFYYFNISGKSHLEWLSIVRRWIMKVVGFNKNGNANPCLVILDYIKLMDASEMGKLEEYQYLGQVLTDLHNASVKYSIPVLAAVQLNRDGITKDDTSVIAGSDRILWLCSSFSIMKNKDESDYSDTGNDPKSGSKKLIVAKSRFGPGTGFGEYINLKCDLSRAKIVEGQTNIYNRSIRSDLIEKTADGPTDNVDIVYDDDRTPIKF